MSLFIATGSNIGDKRQNLELAKKLLCENFLLIAESRIYTSPPVDYLEQPDFFNQVLEFKTPLLKPDECLKILLNIEQSIGRERKIEKGPRVIDIDILFWNFEIIKQSNLTIPHPRLFERSFVVLPLSELPGFIELEKKFKFDYNFDNTAIPIRD